MNMVALFNLEWLQPGGLVLVAWIVPLWFYLRRKERPVRLPSGTLALWKQVGSGGMQEAEHTSPRLSWRAWCWLLGILAGGLAVATPRLPEGTAPELQRLLLDRSPSMFLPLEVGGTETRYESALRRALGDLDERGVPAAARIWMTRGVEDVPGERPPVAWSKPPLRPQTELDPALASDADLTLITDRERENLGGLFASGGAAIPGQIGEWQGRAILWNGTSLVEGGTQDARRVLRQADLPSALGDLVDFWMLERGLHPAENAAESSLILRMDLDGPPTAFEAGRDGWAVRGQAVALESVGSTWLRDEAGRALVTLPGPGQVLVGLRELEPPRGDPAAWAVSWSRLLDRVLLPRPTWVSVEERAAAGASSSRSVPGVPQKGAGEPAPVAAWLALLSLLLGLGAFLTIRSG